ncbi:hypothetical protein TWF718_004449 [Orbilia javanica]|uniref:Pectate lyase domain-containing protein n=1 Tax=Orbilia javanica TaxID=47235 RepID=A0AAN8MXT8_9PEZI
MKFYTFITAGALAATVVATTPKGLDDFSWDVEGYAKDNPVGGKVVGGKGGPTVTVTDYPALATALAGSEPRVVKVIGAIKPEERVIIGSNKSLIGWKNSGSIYEIGVTVANATNVIIQNMKINDVIGNDAITIRNSTRVWIDHNELTSDNNHGPDHYDGLIDIIRGSDYITVSWNYLHDHWKTSLVGNEPTFTHELGKYHVTYHHNYWQRLGTRGPAGRFGFHHIYNNYYEDFYYQAIHSRSDNQALIEGNVFRGDTGEAISTHGLVVPEDSPNFCVCGDDEKDGFANLGYRNDWGSATVNITQVGTFTKAPYRYKLTPLKFVADLVKLGAGIGKVDIDVIE